MDELLGTAATAALAELTGQPPDTHEHDGVLTIRADAAAIPAARWSSLITVLETGTSYGMTTTAAGAKTVWLRIDPEETPRS
ncbi:hypothetical protein OG906_43055 (plasmid) [Streptomyces sp. NBC_01426]|uniref:hypothetical protein n=1 Tax=Streptomyces sp. NBC_01426 TaxID=2975866 RepID=UPI002E306A88|nr:hypothetical protein [Streptomyces sp. NBC_01426]